MLLPAPTLSTVVFWQVLGLFIREKISCVLIRSRTSYPRSEHTRINGQFQSLQNKSRLILAQ